MGGHRSGPAGVALVGPRPLGLTPDNPRSVDPFDVATIRVSGFAHGLARDPECCLFDYNCGLLVAILMFHWRHFCRNSYFEVPG